MRKLLLPLFLCLFFSISGWSTAPTSTEDHYHSISLNTDNVVFTDLKRPESLIKTGDKNSLIVNHNVNAKNLVLFKNSNKTENAVIKPISVFSYNLINTSSVSTATNLSSIHINSNLFNQGLFYGFALTLILLNLVCYFIFDESLFAMFAATFAALTATLFFAEGMFPLIGIAEIVQSEILQSTFLLFAIGLSALFANKYLVAKDYYSKLHHITIPLLIASTVLISMAWVTGNELMATIANAILFGLISIYFIVGVLLFSRKNYAKFYVIASFIPLLFSIDFFVLQNFGIDFLFTEAIHLKVAVLFEALLLSYAILYRMQAVKEEGVLRQTEMRIFLKRQDVMSRNKVEEMIEDIYLENLIMQYDLDGLEIKLLQYISEGKANAKIARKLKITESELGEITKELYQKLEISEQIKEDHRMIDNQPDFIYN